MRRQRTFRVTLTELRTADVRWILRASDQRALSLLQDDLDVAAAGMRGGAPHHWDFRAQEAGNIEIVFDYCRA
jgi:predicted secreted protein